MQKDLTKVKIFQKSFRRGYFVLKHCMCNSAVTKSQQSLTD